MWRIFESITKIDYKLNKIFNSFQKEIKFLFIEKCSSDVVKDLPQVRQFPNTLPEKMLENLEAKKNEYLMLYDEEGEYIDNHYFSSSERLTRHFPRPNNQYSHNLDTIPLLYRWMNLSLTDMQKIFLDEGLSLEKTEEGEYFFTSLPETVMRHAIDATAATITSIDDMKRMAVVLAISPKTLMEYGYPIWVSRWDWNFSVAKNLPKEILAQMTVYIYNHRTKSLDQFM